MLPSLQPTDIINSDAEEIARFVDDHIDRDSDVLTSAVALYYAVRDKISYNPYLLSKELLYYPASTLLARAEGHCVDKSIFLVACLRNACIPAKLGLAKVRNHMGTSNFEKILGTDTLVPHGYVDVFSNDKWVKCTPAFDHGLCAKLEVDPLQWDGKSDSIFQQYDRGGNMFMQYMQDYGSFTDVPTDMILELVSKHYPHLIGADGEIHLPAKKG